MAVRRLTCPTGSDGYDTAISYFYKAEELNSFGEAVGADDLCWTLVDSFYGNIKTGNGNEVYRAKKIHSEATAVITLPFNSVTREFDADGRFEINGKVYNILFAANENEQNNRIIFGCRHEST